MCDTTHVYDIWYADLIGISNEQELYSYVELDGCHKTDKMKGMNFNHKLQSWWCDI